MVYIPPPLSIQDFRESRHKITLEMTCYSTPYRCLVMSWFVGGHDFAGLCIFTLSNTGFQGNLGVRLHRK